MKTRNVLIICVTALLIAWLKYWTPIVMRTIELQNQTPFYLGRPLQPSVEIVPEPEARNL